MSPVSQKFASNAHFEAARDVVMARCSMCHAAEPVWDGVPFTPKSVKLETDAEIASHAREIYIQAGRSHAMPPGNITDLTPDERKLLVAWYESAIASQ
ncbi:Cytochrome c [compost metagenome]